MSPRLPQLCTVAALVVVCPWIAAPPVHADMTQKCVTAYEQAQKLRRKGQLLSSHEQLLVCIRDTCPEVLRRDCAQWLDQVEKATPSLVVEARDSEGRDVPNVTVKLDGTEVTKFDGKAFQLDPGNHVVQVEAEGLSPSTEQLVVLEGEQHRKVQVVLRNPTVRPVPASVYLLAGTGVVALGLTAGFGIKGLNDRSALEDKGCKPHCPSEDVDSIRTSYLIANISLGVGIAAVGAATILYFTRPETTVSRPNSPSGLRLQPSIGLGSFILNGVF